MEKYLKYYWLEKYLEEEVCPAFHKNHYLTAKQFFEIIRWKAPGLGAEPIRRELKKQNNSIDIAVENLTKKIWEATTKEDKLNVLLQQNGFQLAMASGVLTILYPDDFSVYDWRVRSQLNYPDISYSPNRINRYFNEYIKRVKESDEKLSLRDCDRALWAKSWLQSLDKLISKV